MIRLLLVGFCCAVSMLLGAVTRYSTAANGFAALSLADVAVIDGERLVIDNKTAALIVVMDSAAVSTKRYRYTVRFANSHNRAGRSYEYVRADGSRAKRGRTACGVAFNITRGDTTFVMMSCYNTAPGDDITDSRLADIVVSRHTSQGQAELARWTVDDKVDLYDGLTGLAVDVDGDNVSVLVGRHTLNLLGTVTVPRAADVVRLAVAAGSAGLMSVERVMLRSDDDRTVVPMTRWTLASLQSHFAASLDAYEGFYDYLDRDLDEGRVRLGGRYRVALVATDDGYDIVYVSGAQVNQSLWHTGMLKGRLVGTQFANHYNLMWIDAEQLLIDTDVTASLSDGVFLSLNFPTLGGTMRFAKEVNR